MSDGVIRPAFVRLASRPLAGRARARGGKAWHGMGDLVVSGLRLGSAIGIPAGMAAPESFTIGHDSEGEPIRRPLHQMTPPQVVAAVRIQRATVKRIGRHALGVFKRVAAANPDTGDPMPEMAAKLEASEEDKAFVRDLVAEQARMARLEAAIRARMPRWDPERRNLPDALAVWWPVRFAKRPESGTPDSAVDLPRATIH